MEAVPAPTSPQINPASGRDSGMDELIAFICSHCGQSVTVEPPKIH
jgi:hypothetical protein